MSKPKISIIAAISENKVIGRDNKLPWNIPEDLKRLKRITLNHPIIMGRKTYDSIGKPLPNRINIILTRDKQYKVDGAIVAHSIEQAIDKAKEVDPEEIFIFGGGEIFRQAMKYTTRLYLTYVHVTIDGDSYFPDYAEFTKETFHEEHKDFDPPYTFVNLEK